jgi:hypothetical protein
MGNVERVRPPVPNIPGLTKGKIEAKRELWASRRRTEFSENKSDLFVISKEMELFLKLPVLGIFESKPAGNQISGYRLWMPRVYRTTGAIYITRWESAASFDRGTTVPFGGRKFSEGMDVTAVPKSWSIARLIPQRYESIDGAIEASAKIAEYEGREGPAQKRVEELFAALNGISDVFLHEEEISPLRLEGLAKQAEYLLSQHGLLTARDKVWKKIADYTLRSTRKDSKGRVNPMISRILARAAYLSAVHRELRQRASREKALKLYFYLTDVKRESKGRLEDAQLMLDNLGGFAYSRPVAALNGELRWIEPREALPLEHALKSLVRNYLLPVEAAPYAQTARLAEAILIGKIGKSNLQVESLKQSLTEEGRRELVRKSAVEYLMERDATSGRKRMHQAFNVLGEGLKVPDTTE